MFTRKTRPETIRRKTSPRALKFEGLENRALMATIVEGITYIDGLSIQGVTVEGTDRPEQVEVRMEGSQLVVAVSDGVASQTWRGSPKFVFFHGRGGDDRFVNNTHVTSYAWGDAGNDRLQGGNQVSWPGDQLVGGGGNDVIVGNEGHDYLFGDLRGWGDGLNPGIPGDDQIFGGGGVNSIYGGPGQDLLYGGNDRDYINGNAGHDQIFGLGGDDWLWGGDGNDSINGGFGNDRLFGADGADYLIGEQGDDYLNGGADRYSDTLVGDYLHPTTGLGRDTYVQNFVQEREYSTNGWYIDGDSWYDAIVGFNPLEGDKIDTQVHYVGFSYSGILPLKTATTIILPDYRIS